MGIERAPSLPKFVMVAAVVRSGQSKRILHGKQKEPEQLTGPHSYVGFRTVFVVGERRETRPATQFRAVSENVSVPLLL